MAAFFREEREAFATAVEAQREVVAVHLAALRSEMESRWQLSHQQLARETEGLKFTLATHAVTVSQLSALQTRLEALHAAQLLSEVELFALENTIGDFVAVRSMEPADNTDELRGVVRTVGQLVGLSEGLANDSVCARQMRRRCLG